MTAASIRPSLRPHPLRAALPAMADAAEASPTNDLRLFLTARLGGLIFFGTFLA